MGKLNATVYCSNKFSETVKNWIRFGDLFLTNRNTIWPLTISRKNHLRALIRILNYFGESLHNKNSSNRCDLLLHYGNLTEFLFSDFFELQITSAVIICFTIFLHCTCELFHPVWMEIFNPARLVRSNIGFGAFSFGGESIIYLRSRWTN